MLIQHIALVPESDQLDLSQLARVSAALQKQVLRDVLPFWRVGASVDAFPRFEDVPAGYWPIVVTYRELGGNAGVHIDRNGQPFAQVQAADNWSLDASRACLELLINPFENRTTNARSARRASRAAWKRCWSGPWPGRSRSPARGRSRGS